MPSQSLHYLTNFKITLKNNKALFSVLLLQRFQMPGTIQVSVLGLMDLPSSLSSSSSSVSVQVSMGKKEYQTWDKGDFSFPLMTLRDNLVITLHDTEGNELSRTGVEILSVIEKGFLDEFFPLEGGGRLHLTLQFILSKEDRNRIRELRETALKKKHVELLTSSSERHSEKAAVSDVGGNAMSSSLSLNHEVTDSQESLVQMEATSNTNESSQNDSVSNSDSCAKVSISGSGNEEGIPMNQPEQPGPTDVDGSEGTSSTILMSQELELLHTEATQNFVEKIETKLPNTNTPMKPIFSLKALDPPLGFSKSLVAKNNQSVSSTAQEDQIHIPENQTAIKRASSVKNMISAFESNLTQKHNPIDALTLKSQPKKTLMTESSLKGPNVKLVLEKNRKQEIAETEPSSSSLESQEVNLQQSSKDISGQRDEIGFKQHKEEENVNELEILLEAGSAEETATILRKAPGLFSTTDEPTAISQPNKTVIKSSLKGSSVKDDEIGLKQHKENVNEPEIRAPLLFPPSDETITKSEPKRTTIEGSLMWSSVKDDILEKSKAQQIAEIELSLSSMGESQEVKLESLNSIREQRDVISLKQHEEENKEHGMLREELSGLSVVETASVSTRMPDKPVDTDQSCSVSKDQQDSALEVLGNEEWRTCTEDSDRLDIPSSSEKNQSVAYSGVEQYPFDSLGSCILLDDSRRLCITTGSKQVMDLIGSRGVVVESDQRKRILSSTEAMNEKNTNEDICNEVNEDERSSCSLRTSKLERSAEVGVSGRRIGQAVRVAIMVAFGTFVLITRERKK